MVGNKEKRKDRGRDLFMSSKISDVVLPPTSGESSDEETSMGGRSERDMFKVSMANVHELGGAQLKGRARKEWEKEMAARKGVKAPKNPKVPYNILMGMRKKAKEREFKRIQRGKERGMEVQKKKPKEMLKKPNGQGLKLNMGGSFKKGMLTMNKRSFESSQKSKGKSSQRKSKGGRKRPRHV